MSALIFGGEDDESKMLKNIRTVVVFVWYRHRGQDGDITTHQGSRDHHNSHPHWVRPLVSSKKGPSRICLP